LPLKPARARYDAMFLGLGTPVTQFQWLHLHSLCGASATLFGSHQLHLPPFVWQSLVELLLGRLLTSVCNAWQRSRTQIVRRVGKNAGPMLTICGPNFTKFWHYVGNSVLFSVHLPDYLWRFSFRRHSPLSLEVVEKTEYNF